jgi:RNA polymerase sigma-70 factor (ECF subfamily)
VTARRWVYIEPLHFTDRIRQRPQANHGHRPSLVARHQQDAARRCVIARQTIDLGVDLLKGQVKRDPVDVVAHQLSNPRQVVASGGAYFVSRQVLPSRHVVSSRPVPPRADALWCGKPVLPSPQAEGPQSFFQPRAEPPSLSDVTLAQLAVPMLVTTAPREDGDPEVARLVTLAKAGDCVAFGRLIEDHLPVARRVALAAVGQPSDADEAVQEASVAAWKRLEALQDPGAFRGWFMRIVWRKALDRRRSLRSWFERFGGATIDASGAPQLEHATPDRSPDALLMSRELEAAIAEVIKALPQRLRDPFLLAASGDDRYEEIATLLRIPIGTVKWRISEARRLTRVKLERLGHGVPR